MRSGVRKDGTLTFRDVRTLHDNGGYVSWGARTPLVMMMTFASLYRLPHCRYRTTIVYTNNPYSGSFRGFGNLQATFPLESHMDRLAEAIAMDPLELRLRNAHEPGDVGPQGTRFTTCGFRECLTIAAARSGFTAKHRAHRAGPAGPGALRRGIGIAATIHVGGGAKIYRSDGCGTILKLDDFAHATVISGGTDIGQGLDTVLTQIVGEELGLQPDDVTVVGGDTAIAPWDVGVHASRSTFVAGNSARRAARKARERILEEAARQANVPASALDLRGGHVVQADNGVAVVALDKLLRGLHFDREDADVIVAADYYEPAQRDAGREPPRRRVGRLHLGLPDRRGRGRYGDRDRAAAQGVERPRRRPRHQTGSASRARSRGAWRWAPATRSPRIWSSSAAGWSIPASPTTSCSRRPRSPTSTSP